MREVHEGVCRIHLRARLLIHKLIRVGYYWPTMQKDAHFYMKARDKCQHFSNVVRQLSKPLTLMNAPWPFTQWGLDIIRPFSMAIQQLKFLVEGIDYFTKRVEAEQLAIVTEKSVRNFIWKSIIC